MRFEKLRKLGIINLSVKPFAVDSGAKLKVLVDDK